MRRSGNSVDTRRRSWKMNDVEPRYEFRTFAPCLGTVAERMRQLSSCEQIEESMEAYITSADMHNHNVKVRNGFLDIKRLVRRCDDLEQWKPIERRRFPISLGFATETLIPILQAPDLVDSAGRNTYTATELLSDCSRPQIGVFVASVFKRRFRFTVGECAAEIDELLINGAAMQSVAIESEDESAVARARTILGMNDCENVNYLLAVQRVLGLQPLPDDAWYRFRGGP